MAKQYQSIEPNHQKFILQQRIFFADGLPTGLIESS
jgi:hypothetical protein